MTVHLVRVSDRVTPAKNSLSVVLYSNNVAKPKAIDDEIDTRGRALEQSLPYFNIVILLLLRLRCQSCVYKEK